LDLKYAQRAHQLRLAAGKDTGVVHFDDGRVRITADLPKKVEWDQAKLERHHPPHCSQRRRPRRVRRDQLPRLRNQVQRLARTLKSAFAPARTLKTGKPGFRLALIQE
jgi:hypothetical protein